MISYPWLEEVAQKLDQLLSSKVLTLEGPKGLGKKEIAHEIAKHKLCSSNNACGDCNACKTFVAGTHPDFFILNNPCLLYTSPSPRDYAASRMPSSA